MSMHRVATAQKNTGIWMFSFPHKEMCFYTGNLPQTWEKF